MSPLPHRHLRGFTLTELLVGIAVIAVLTTLAISVTGRVASGSDRTTGLNDLKQIGLAMHLYAQDHHGGIPPFNGNPQRFKEGIGNRSNSTGNSSSFAELLIPNYLKDNEVFFARADKRRRDNRDTTTRWARDPSSTGADRHSYVYIYMNPSSDVVNASRAFPREEGGMGYGALWNVRQNHPAKVVAYSVYTDSNWPVYTDGTMVLRLGGSVEWYENGRFRRDRSSIGQFDVRAE